jgi:hypothetical protein
MISARGKSSQCWRTSHNLPSPVISRDMYRYCSMLEMMMSCTVTSTKNFAMIANSVETNFRYPGHYAAGNGHDDVADGALDSLWRVIQNSARVVCRSFLIHQQQNPPCRTTDPTELPLLPLYCIRRGISVRKISGPW